jgi:hypothetical protein
VIGVAVILGLAVSLPNWSTRRGMAEKGQAGMEVAR